MLSPTLRWLYLVFLWYLPHRKIVTVLYFEKIDFLSIKWVKFTFKTYNPYNDPTIYNCNAEGTLLYYRIFGDINFSFPTQITQWFCVEVVTISVYSSLWKEHAPRSNLYWLTQETSREKGERPFPSQKQDRKWRVESGYWK